MTTSLSHRFVALTTLLLGLSLGLSSLTGQRHLDLLKQTSEKLNTYSEWLLGRDLLASLIADPHALTLTGRKRALLFADIRGFTSWCEVRTPEAIVALINRYYDVAESVLNREFAALLEEHGLGAGIGIHAGPMVEGLLGSGGGQLQPRRPPRNYRQRQVRPGSGYLFDQTTTPR